MAYIATLAARQSQFGVMVAEFNLIDSSGVMPKTRRSWTFQTLTPTQNQINNAKNNIINSATNDYNDYQTKLANEAAFKSKLGDFLDIQLDNIRATYAIKVGQTSLNAAQLAIANSVTFSWKYDN